MAITVVGYAAAVSSTLTLPSFQAGDMILVSAYRSTSNTAINVPGTFTGLNMGTFTNDAGGQAYRIAQAGDSTSVSFTNATDLQAVVYRGAMIDSFGASGNNNTTSATITFPNTLTGTWSAGRPGLMPPEGWSVHVAAHRTATNVPAMALSGLTNRSTGGASGKLGWCDTNAAITESEVAQVTYVTNGTAVDAHAWVVSIRPDNRFISQANANTVVTTGWSSASNAHRREQITSPSATATPAKNATVDSDFGFPDLDSSVIPDNSTIDAVKMVIYGKISAAVTGGLIGVQGRLNGVNSGTETTSASISDIQLSTTMGAVALSDLRSASTLLKARVRCTKGNTNTAMTGTLYMVRMQVEYTPPVADGGGDYPYIGGGYYP